MIDRTNPTTLYAGIGVRVSKSTDGGATWSEAGGLGIGVNVVAIDPVNPSILYAATNAGLFKSADAGASWFAINEGLANMVDTRSPVTALVVDPANPNILYAGSPGYGVFRSADGGAHWSGFNDGLTNLDVRILALSHVSQTAAPGTGRSGDAQVPGRLGSL